MNEKSKVDDAKADKNAPIPAKPAQPPIKDGHDKGTHMSTKPVQDPAAKSDGKVTAPGGQAPAQPAKDATKSAGH